MSGSVSGVTGTTGAGAAAMPSGLTPEGIMAYCEMQLGSFDQEIKGKMDHQTQMRGAQTVLTSLKAAMTFDRLEPGDTAKKEAILRDMKKAYDALPANDPGRSELNKLFQRFASTACNSDFPVHQNLSDITDHDLTGLASLPEATGPNGVPIPGHSNFVDGNEMRDMGAVVDSTLSNIAKGGEMAMIEIQSAVSRRQQAVQFATNMMSKYNEGIQSVVSNLGK
jgi:hypothetical protein